MIPSFRLRPASLEDHATVIGLIDHAAAWLGSIGSDQWATPWPSRAGRDARILDGIRKRETWLLWNGTRPVATLSVSRAPDRAHWRAAECQDPAVYLHRLVVHRDHAGQGLGALLLDWAAVRARYECGADWQRIDVWAANTALHRYYLGRGFQRVRLCTERLNYPAGMLFQRDTRTPVWEPRIPLMVEPFPGGVLCGRFPGEPAWWPMPALPPEPQAS